MTEFVIVIEADHKRAWAAYSKGLAELEEAMPQLMVLADKVDAARAAEYQRRLDDYKAEQAAEEAEWAAYKQAQSEMDAWRASSTWTRGPKPPEPKLPVLGFFSSRCRPRAPALERCVLESIKGELERMCDLAGAAIGPYRMTEWQVAQMVAWEDGSRIESLRKHYEQLAAAA